MKETSCNIIYLDDNDFNENGDLRTLNLIKKVAYAELTFHINESGEVKLVKDSVGLLQKANEKRKANRKAEVIYSIANALKNR